VRDDDTVGKAPIKHGSLVAKAYEDIKEKIITLYFLPGQYLNEAAISGLLQVGRTPVHQALQRAPEPIDRPGHHMSKRRRAPRVRRVFAEA